MFEDSVASLPSFWASMNSWFTPTVLFVLLNIMIGTIALTSTLANQNQNQTDNSQDPNKLPKSPSLLQRVKSINLYAHKQEHQPNILDTKTLATFENFQHAHKQETVENPFHYMFEESPKENVDVLNTYYELEKVHAEDLDQLQSLEEVYSNLTGLHISRTKSDTEPSSGEVKAKLPRKMRKSASMKSAFGHFEAQDCVERRRPATVRGGYVSKGEELDEEVDAKADDFINKFKEQLKLQRIDSVTKYKEMISRGSEK